MSILSSKLQAAPMFERKIVRVGEREYFVYGGVSDDRVATIKRLRGVEGDVSVSEVNHFAPGKSVPHVYRAPRKTKEFI